MGCKENGIMASSNISASGFVTVIGAANIDIIGRSTNSIILEDSNPGHIETAPGGVGRNIAENLARLGVNVKMVSALADDIFGKQILDISTMAGIDMGYCYKKAGAGSSVYLAILDNAGEMRLALSDMALLDGLPLEYLSQIGGVLKESRLIVLDACLREEAISYILEAHSGIPVFLDPVSVGKSKHVKNIIGRFHTIKVNRLEAEYLSGIKVCSPSSAIKACGYFINLGVKQVFLSDGERGVYYESPEGGGHFGSSRVVPVNATGAGDAFMAGIVYCYLNGYDIGFTTKFATGMARVALSSMETVNPQISVNKIYEEMRSLI
jgi:pseudouridine kinase